MDGKDEFIKKTEEKAKAWREKREAETGSA
jgi:hypothetical protein